jgi:hypothetical protein
MHESHCWRSVGRRVLPLLVALSAGGPTVLRGGEPGGDELRALTGPGAFPQYVFFHKAPTAQKTPFRWHQGRPESFTPESCEQIVKVIGSRGTPRLRIGVSHSFSMFQGDPDTTRKSLQNLLAAAEEADVPVLICIDGQNWWQARPDLWNWWNPDKPGYDPANRMNVEWTDWGPDHAVKIGWRNWGSQIRVRPAPNLASPRFLEAHWAMYDKLIPPIVEWYNHLPPNRKYLFGGLKVGWEASINVNAYYHRDGNRIFEQWPTDPSHDPDAKLHDPSKGWTYGLPPLGYAAVSTAGIRKSGELRKEDIEQVVHQYLERLAHEAHRRGLPQALIFTHQGGTQPPWDEHLSFKPAINDYSIPGYSFYWNDPAECGSLGRDLESAGRQQWAAVEWWLGAGDRESWRRHLERTLAFKQCRHVCVYNWHAFAADKNAVAAIHDLLTSQPTTSAPTGPPPPKS